MKPADLDIAAALKNLEGDEQILREVSRVFLQSTPSLLRECDQAVQAEDRELIHRHAHSIKSASRTIGGIALSLIAERLESAARHDSRPNVRSMVDDAHAAFDRLAALLRKDILC